MSKIREKIEAWMSAVAFAEANEPETALELIGVSPERKKRLSLDSIMAAITFAEAGEHDVAREHLGVEPNVPHTGDLGIPGVRVWIGSFSMEPVAIPGVKVWYGTMTA